MKVQRWLELGILAGAFFGLTAGAAWGISPEDKCQLEKNKIAGKYVLCRQKAAAKAIRQGQDPDYTSCDTKFDDRWGRAEFKAEGLCPTEGDQDAVRAFLSEAADSVRAALDAGGCWDNSSCAPTEYCEKGTNNCDGPGVCALMPLFCPRYYAPVCGCDLITYENACYPHTVGVSIFFEAPCP